jgi:hypothetical protein
MLRRLDRAILGMASWIGPLRMKTTGSRRTPWRRRSSWLACLAVIALAGQACEAPRNGAMPAELDTAGMRVVTIQLAGIG